MLLLRIMLFGFSWHIQEILATNARERLCIALRSTYSCCNLLDVLMMMTMMMMNE